MTLIPISTDCLSLPATHRLVVLVLNYRQIDAFVLGKLVRQMASGNRTPILYLTIVQDYDHELPALHALAHLAAITRDARVRADIMVEYGLSWKVAIQRISCNEDAILCIEDYPIRTGFFHKEQLSVHLARNLRLPVYQYLNGSSLHLPVEKKNGR